MRRKTDFSIKGITFFGTGGSVDLFFAPSSVCELQEFINSADKSIPIVALGHMSNVVVSDDGFRGGVVCFGHAFESVLFDATDNVVFVEAGVDINNLIKQCIGKGISCVEEMYCIPGTVGGAIFMNAGTPLFEISEAVVKVECINKKNGKIVKLNKSDINFQYRKSNIDDDLIITSCVLKMRKGNVDVLANRISEIARKRRQTQPIAERTCGSTFKNPAGEKAWQLIDRSGCRGMRVGGAFVSDLHCNFIINDGTATSADIINLIEQIKKKVFRNTNILLEEEIRLLGSL
ncbi:MAG: UDP-N-acetylmuramate dehydrogenase [Holosporales bacterium]|jgi:UDP-N-acetylmuramate dehydrogenase|nr:UDP-N-acetylmuramate dehydrogenase [Holosporales bacterium]